MGRRRRGRHEARVVLGCSGRLGGHALDALHVVTGVLTYRNPMLGLQDWWAVPLFVGAGLALGLGHRHAAIPLSRAQTLPPTNLRSALLGFGALVFCYGSSGLLQSWPLADLIVYLSIFMGAVYFVDDRARPTLLVHAVGAALLGPAVEIYISSTGAFSYVHPDVFGVAYWLPGIYVNAPSAAISWIVV